MVFMSGLFFEGFVEKLLELLDFFGAEIRAGREMYQERLRRPLEDTIEEGLALGPHDRLAGEGRGELTHSLGIFGGSQGPLFDEAREHRADGVDGPSCLWLEGSRQRGSGLRGSFPELLHDHPLGFGNTG